MADMADEALEDFWKDIRITSGGVKYMDFAEHTLTPEELHEAERHWGGDGKIIFHAAPSMEIGAPQPAILELCPNGDIFVNGRLAENDKQVVEAMRQFLRTAR